MKTFMSSSPPLNGQFSLEQVSTELFNLMKSALELIVSQKKTTDIMSSAVLGLFCTFKIYGQRTILLPQDLGRNYLQAHLVNVSALPSPAWKINCWMGLFKDSTLQICSPILKETFLTHKVLLFFLSLMEGSSRRKK